MILFKMEGDKNAENRKRRYYYQKRDRSHILDSHNGYLGLSNDLLDMGPDLMEFIRGHIFKILDSDVVQRNASLTVVSPNPGTAGRYAGKGR